jgi:hypothetical protein
MQQKCPVGLLHCHWAVRLRRGSLRDSCLRTRRLVVILGLNDLAWRNGRADIRFGRELPLLSDQMSSHVMSAQCSALSSGMLFGSRGAGICRRYA